MTLPMRVRIRALVLFGVAQILRPQLAISVGPAPSVDQEAALLRQLASMNVVVDQGPLRGWTAVSPDGRWLAFTVAKSGEKPFAVSEEDRDSQIIPWEAQLFVRDLRSERVVRVTSAPATTWMPSWSPDSSKLAFYAAERGKVYPHIFDIQTGRERQVGDGPIQLGAASAAPAGWTPDGGELLLSEVPTTTTGSQDFLPPGQGERAGGPTRTPLFTGADVAAYYSGTEVSAGTRTEQDASQSRDQFFFNPNADLRIRDAYEKNVRNLVSATDPCPPTTGALSPSGKWLAYLTSAFNVSAQTKGRYDADKIGPLVADLVVVPTKGGTPVLVEHDVDYPTNGLPQWLTRDRLLYARADRIYVSDAESAKATFRSAWLAGDVVRHDLVRTYGRYESRDGKSLLAIGAALVGRERSLVWIPFSQTTQRISLPTDLVLEAVVASHSGTLWQPKPDTATITALNTTTNETVLLRIDLRTQHVDLLSHGRGTIQPVDILPDHSGMIALFEDPEHAPDLWEFSPVGARVRRLTELNPDLPTLQTGSTEYLSTRAPRWDGKMVSTTYTVILPRGAKRGDHLPAVVAIYPHMRMFLDATRFLGGRQAGVPAAMLLKHGYAVIYADLPTRPYDTSGNLAQESTDVLLPQLYHAADLGYIDINRVALFGWSQGGYTAAAIATQTHLFRAVVAGASGAFDLPGEYGMILSGMTIANRWPELGLNMGGSPWDQLPRYLANSPYYQVQKIENPTLLLLGDKDDDRILQESLKFYAALQATNKSAQLAIYHGEGHELFGGTTANSVDASLRMLNFLDRNLLSQSSSP